MKRLIIALLGVFASVAVFAKAPELNVENLFDGRYNNRKSVAVSVYKSNGNFYRGLTVKNDPGIIKDIAEAMTKDKPKASDFSDYRNKGERYMSILVVNNGVPIYIGLQCDGDGDGFFFIQGLEKAFE